MGSISPTHCNTLQHTATHCNTLQHSSVLMCVAVCCNKHSLPPKPTSALCGSTMQCVAVRCCVLQCVAVFAVRMCAISSVSLPSPLSVVQYGAVWYSVLQCVAVCGCMLQCVVMSVCARSAVWCSVLQCVAVCCSVLQCVAVCCSVLLHVAACCSVLQCVAMSMCATCADPLPSSPLETLEMFKKSRVVCLEYVYIYVSI